MLKQWIALGLILSFGLFTFNRSIIVVDYFMNTGSFAKDCINKSRPKMHCNGKCQMMKKLKEEEKKDAQNPERRSENKNDIPLSSRSFFAAIIFYTHSSNAPYTNANDGRLLKMPHPVFHPPA